MLTCVSVGFLLLLVILIAGCLMFPNDNCTECEIEVVSENDSFIRFRTTFKEVSVEVSIEKQSIDKDFDKHNTFFHITSEGISKVKSYSDLFLKKEILTYPENERFAIYLINNHIKNIRNGKV